MKQLILLACIALACTAFSCSSDGGEDNTVRYDETKGYLCNLASAKHGIIGRWEIANATTAHYEYHANGTRCTGAYNLEELTDCEVTYEVIQKGGKFYIKGRNSSWPVGEYSEMEITLLTKTKLSFIPYAGESAVTRLNRMSGEPNP